MNKEVLASHVADIEAGMKEYMPEENGYQRTVFEAVNYSLLAGDCALCFYMRHIGCLAAQMRRP